MIPRCINFFWSGPRMSFMRYLTLASFRRWNPDFSMVLWSPATPCIGKTWHSFELDDTGYTGPDYMPMLDALDIERKTWTPSASNLSHSHASDLFQWELLSTTGGFYADMDILWVRSMKPLYEQYKDVDSLFCLERNGEVCAIGFFGASPACPVFKDIHAASLKHYSPRGYETAGALAVYCAAGSNGYIYPGSKVLNAFRARYPQLTISQAPDETLYYFNCDTYPGIFETSVELPKVSVGLHWFGGGPCSQKWNRLLTADNFRDYDNTFTRYCQTVYE